MEVPVSVNTWIGCEVGDAVTIAKQAGQIATLFADFVGKTQRSLHIAIYDFRLDPGQGTVVIGALNALAARGLDVRVAYFQQPPNKNTNKDGGDPSPGTKASDFNNFNPKIAVKAIKGIDVGSLPRGVKKEPIEGGGHLMHSKYMVRDGESVWTGSANFTTDAWSVQDNNVVQLTSPEIATCYETDFGDLWSTGRIAGTGKNDLGNANVGGFELDVAFSPGDGSTVEKEIAGAIAGAQKSVRIASMVISSGAILGALIDAIDRGVTLSGVYDGPEMKVVLADWAKGGKSAGKATQWAKIKTKLVPKWSIPYTPSGPHNFMHNKLAAVDGKLAVTGSFNFSQNATHNAENLLTLRDPVLVSQYSKYVDQLVATYTGDRPARAALQKTRKAKTGRKTGRR